MKRFLLLLVVAGVAAVGAAWWLATLPGEATVRFADLVIETSSGLAVVLAAIALALLLLSLRVILAVIAIPRSVGRWLAHRRRRAGDAAVAAALVALAANDGAAARRAARRARHLLGDTAQTLLLDAEAHRLASDEDAAALVYRQMAARDDAGFLGLRGLFRQAMARHDWAEAATLAARADALRPGATWLTEARLGLAVRTEDWAAAARLATPGAARLGFATAANATIDDPERALAAAKRTWETDRGFTPAALAYGRRLRMAMRESRAHAVLAETWTRAPHPDLASLALQPVTEPLSRIATARKLIAGAPDHPESHFLLARLSLAAGLVGEARRHLGAARAAGLGQRRLWLLAAELEVAEHAPAAAERAALHEAASAEPDPAWQCDACGTAHAAWHAACPACAAVTALRWGGRQRLALR